jgi:hypothetical protein
MTTNNEVTKLSSLPVAPGHLIDQLIRANPPQTNVPVGQTLGSGSRKKRIAIVGYGRHGKDFLAEIFDATTHLKYGGSCSWAALPYVAAELGVHPQLAWEKRHNQRQFWYEFCNYLRRDDPTFLIKKVLEQGDMVVGIRDKAELDAMKEQKLVDHTIWVDAAPRITFEDTTVTFSKEDCDSVFDNSRTKESAYLIAYHVAEFLGLPRKSEYITDWMNSIERAPWESRNTFAA